MKKDDADIIIITSKRKFDEIVGKDFDKWMKDASSRDN